MGYFSARPVGPPFRLFGTRHLLALAGTGLGVAGTIRSPTYTLVEPYALRGGGQALHLDLYRIGDPGELEFLGLDEDSARLWLVEWPERGAGALPAPDLRVQLAVAGEGRLARIESGSSAGEAWIDAAHLG